MKDEIRDYILNQLSEHPNDITTVTAKKFHISRQTAVNYLTKLAKEGMITATGKTRARKYELKNLVEHQAHKQVVPGMAEDVLWREDILPLMGDTPSDVVGICQYGFTEIVRNVFDHSESRSFLYGIIRNVICINLFVLDHGIGIFNKIQRDFELNDPRHALLELSKGKLTSDPKGHTGEGIFFASRMFDEFRILSEPLFYNKSMENNEWLIEVDKSDQKGTLVRMKITPYSTRTTKSVFDEYAPDKDTFGFTKTHVPIKLARYESEQLVSRSQARRLLARFERFQEVLLDFKGVTTIGQSFADEIFRVYQLEHPEVKFFWIDATQDVERMIQRAKTNLRFNDGLPISTSST